MNIQDRLIFSYHIAYQLALKHLHENHPHLTKDEAEKALAKEFEERMSRKPGPSDDDFKNNRW